MRLGFRRFVFTGVMAGLLFLVGCDHQAYDEAMEDGAKAIEKEAWNEALGHFEAALKEKSGDEDAEIAIEQVGLLHAGMEAMMDGEVDEAVKSLKEVVNGTGKFEVIVHKAEEILTDIEKVDQYLEEIDAFVEKEEYKLALEKLEGLKESEAEKRYMAAFEPQVSELEEELKKEELLFYMKGYSSTENEEDQVIACEVTDQDIACGLILIDMYYFVDIDQVALLSDDALTVTMTDGSKLDVTNITETSFHMHGHTFQSVEKEEIDNMMEYMTLDRFLDRETLRDIYASNLGGRLFVDDSREDSQVAESEEKLDGSEEGQEKTGLEGYTAEEIIYASVWASRYKGPNAPDVNVSFKKKGERVNPYTEKAIAYPEDVVFLKGEFTADGMITFSINEDGSINEYQVPIKWNFSGDDEILKETLKAVDSAEKKEVPLVSTEEILHVLETMEIYD